VYYPIDTLNDNTEIVLRKMLICECADFFESAENLLISDIS